MTQDTIFIEDLCVPASIGVFEWEKDIKQELYFDVELAYSFAQAANTDDIRDAICYADVAKHIVDIVDRRHYELLENLVEIVAQDLLSTFAIDRVLIKLSKPGAVPDARNVGVRIERVRSS